MEIEARLAGDGEVSRDERRWLESYRAQPEYHARKRMFGDFGKDMFG